MVYDAPKAKGTFQQRLKTIERKLKELKSEYVIPHKHEVCTDMDHLTKELDRVTADGGEGVMIKDPDSKYENKRSDKLLKVKKFEDAEATVYGHQKGTGRCSDMCGAILVRGDDGIEFKIGSGFNDA
jgi:DNA ligase-1